MTKHFETHGRRGATVLRHALLGLAVALPLAAAPAAAPLAQMAGQTEAPADFLQKPVMGAMIGAASLRAEPGSGGNAGRAGSGAAVEILDSRDGWHQVRTSGGAAGWVRHDSVALDMNTVAAGVPVVGEVTRGVTVRSGPGTNNRRLGTAPAGAEALVLASQGRWYRVTTTVDGRTRSGWVRNDFLAADVDAGHRVVEPMATPTNARNSDLLNQPLNGGERRVVYAGYSESGLDVKQALATGGPDAALNAYVGKGVAPAAPAAKPGERKNTPAPGAEVDTDGFLGQVEIGALSLDAGARDKAIESFALAEYDLVQKKLDSGVGAAAGDALGAIGEFITGNNELRDYVGAGYERILMLNYKTLAYLMDGDRKAYNVTRRAIDWQNIEKRRFEAELAAQQKDIEESKKDGSEAAGQVESLFSRMDALDARADTVASAYVNPLGYYIAGLVQELDSQEDVSLRDNARISYEKALELNPNSAVLRQAADELKQTVDSGKRRVHVIVADGFAPEKKTVMYGLPLDSQTVVPIKVPVMEPVVSGVRRIEVRDSRGRLLEVASPLADIEAIALRHQKDRQPALMARVILDTVRSGIEKVGLNSLGIFGKIISNVRDATSHPDMRSWSSLPGSILAARVDVPDTLTEVRVVAIGDGGRELSSQTVTIGKKQHAIVYARTIDGFMTAQVNEALWTERM